MGYKCVCEKKKSRMTLCSPKRFARSKSVEPFNYRGVTESRRALLSMFVLIETEEEGKNCQMFAFDGIVNICLSSETRSVPLK